MKSSIVSYPNRGHWGNSKWRGNTSGHIVKELIEYYEPRTFVDPAVGGGTSTDVVKDLRSCGYEIEYFGLDLHSGFNLLADSLSERIKGNRADLVFFHPPYDSIIPYSGSMWGNPHPDDLSRCTDYEDFLMKMRVAMQNIYDAVKPGKNYSILIGDVRRQGKFTSIQADLIQLAPGTLEAIVIKAQHNVLSDNRRYSGKFFPIQHEYLLNFKKSEVIFGMLDSALNISRRLQTLARANWRGTIFSALRVLGGSAALSEIYQVIEETARNKTAARPNWKARVRAELQLHFKPLERGVWAIGN